MILPMFGLLTLLGACSGSSAPDPAAPQATTSGGIATINTGSTVLAFIPIGTSISIVELETPSTAIGVEKITSAAPLLPRAMSTPIATTFEVDSCGADSVSLKVVCVGYDSSMVAIADISGLLAGTTAPAVIEFDSMVESSQSFSGGSCVNCGVLADAGLNQFIVSSSDGYRVFDYNGVLKASYLSDSQTDPARDLSTENFSFDPKRRLIISPEYNSGSDQHLYLINVDTGIIYRWVNRMVSSDRDEEFGLDSLADIGLSTMTSDSAAVDPSTGVVTIGNEGKDVLLLLNLAAAIFDDANNTFDAPDSVLELEKIAASRLSTGQAIEPVSHLLFLENESKSAMGVVELPTNTSAGTLETGNYISADIPPPADACPGVFSWTNVGDPHGLAIFTSNTIGSSPKGLLINSRKTCAAVVDLKLFLATPREDVEGSNTVDSDIDLLASGVLRFVEIPQP
jgi:hypothetical protein